jgi:hypothetical protein
MKKLLYIFIAGLTLFITSCSDDEWGNNNPEMEHVYYFGFQDWGTFKNNLTYNVQQGDTVGIPVQFFSERVRSYDVTTFYYTQSTLTLGTDYQVVDADGSTLNPNEAGAYSFVWPKAQKGIKRVYVKALNGMKGKVEIHTFNPNDTAAISYQNTVNNKTPEYEVRAFTQNYKVTINIQ